MPVTLKRRARHLCRLVRVGMLNHGTIFHDVKVPVYHLVMIQPDNSWQCQQDEKFSYAIMKAHAKFNNSDCREYIRNNLINKCLEQQVTKIN